MTDRPRRLYAILITTALASIILGFVIDFQSFVSNFFAEAAGLLVSVVIGLTLVDRFSRNQDRQEWIDVRAALSTSLRSMVHDICFAADSSIIFSGSRPESDDPGPSGIARYVSRNTEELAQGHAIFTYSRDHPEGSYKIDVDEYSSRTLLNAVDRQLSYMRQVTTPRIIQARGDRQLIEALIKVEDAGRRWSSTVAFIEDDWGLPETFAWKAVAEFYDCLAELDVVLPSNSGMSPVIH